MRTSERGIEFIKKWEGFRGVAYQCAAGHWTIGFGDTLGVRPGQTITEEDADVRLRARLIEYENGVEHYLEVPVTQNQFDALVSLTYNIGVSAFGGSSLVKRINAGLPASTCSGAFLKWDKGRKDGKLVVMSGLKRRREAEQRLFLEPN